MGTRRRFSFDEQMIVNSIFYDYKSPYYLGTSNVMMSMILGTDPVGTIAHEFYQAISVLESMNHPNKIAIEKLNQINTYDQKIIALVDTFGVNSFLKDLNKDNYSIINGFRIDSGNPIKVANKIISYIKDSLFFDPTEKSYIFSDSLDVDKAVFLKKIFNEYKCIFGIGTNFTCDIKDQGINPLNIVIKLCEVNNEYVVKLSDSSGKISGDVETIQMIKKIHNWVPTE